MNRKYVIISPVRNEASHLPATIASVAAQTILPQQWVIIDDGSTDGSVQILEAAAATYSWIKIVRRKDRGMRKPGTGVIEAFYEGYPMIRVEWDYLVKLDGDVSFETAYFEKCFVEFEKNPKLGIGGGTVCRLENGQATPESKVDPAFHVRGATKIYKRECWNAIGELIRAPGWDTLDELKANMLGWTTLTFPHLQIIHHKFAGSADGSWRNWVKNGLANYIVGYHPLFMVLKSGRRFFCKPYAISAIALLTGFFSGYIKGVPQIPDKALIRYLRRQQLKRMAFQPSLWSNAS
jgi:glycosyltransferase involved in cell wall biosynthesis